MGSRRSFLGAVGAASLKAAGAGWKVVYRGDSDHLITDLHVSGASVLAVSQGQLLTSWDAGETWDHPPSTDNARTGFVLDRDNLWLIGSTGLWKSADGAKTWKRQLDRQGLERAYFLSAERGFVCGANKTLLETVDAGETWVPVAAAEEPQTVAAFTTYGWIDFVTPRVGIVTGSSRPPRRGNTGALPAWRDPMKQTRRREWPGASITLETRDAGLNWKHSTTSLFGRINRVRYSRDGHGLAVVEFHDAFDWPSEVFAIRLRNGSSERCYREKERAVTDAMVFSGSSGWLAAIEPPEDPGESTLGVLHVLESSNLAEWTESDLPEMIAAGRAFFSGKGEDEFWLATDTGYLLKRVV